IRTLHGVVTALVFGRKGPARGGVLGGADAQRLRDIIAEHGAGRVPGERGPVRGLSRLLRRHPTEAERALLRALVDRPRRAGRGFKRQVPIGPHIADFVSFPLRVVVDIVSAQESNEAQANRAERRGYFVERGYQVVEVKADDVERNVAKVLEELAAAMPAAG